MSVNQQDKEVMIPHLLDLVITDSAEPAECLDIRYLNPSGLGDYWKFIFRHLFQKILDRNIHLHDIIMTKEFLNLCTLSDFNWDEELTSCWNWTAVAVSQRASQCQ